MHMSYMVAESVESAVEAALRNETERLWLPPAGHACDDDESLPMDALPNDTWSAAAAELRRCSELTPTVCMLLVDVDEAR